MKIERPASRQTIPPEAKKVFAGVIFDVYQWEVDDYNGQKLLFEKVSRLDTVMIIPVTAEGKIIILEQQQPAGLIKVRGH